MNPFFPFASYSTPQRLSPSERPGDWQAVLDPGERLLWSGRPVTGFHVRIRHLGVSILGLIFTPFALWLSFAAWGEMQEQPENRPVLLGIIVFFVLAGVWLIAGMHVIDMLRRRGMHYALTDRRALTDVDFLGRVAYGVEIGPDNPVWLARTNPGSAFYGQLPPPPGLFGNFGGPRRRNSIRLLGFELIEEAAAVHDLLQQVQTEARARRDAQDEAAGEASEAPQP